MLSCLRLNAIFFATNASLLVGSLLILQRRLEPHLRLQQLRRISIVSLQILSTLLSVTSNLLGIICVNSTEEDNSRLLTGQLGRITCGIQCLTAIYLIANSSPILSTHTRSMKEELIELLPNESDDENEDSINDNNNNGSNQGSINNLLLVIKKLYIKTNHLNMIFCLF